MKSLIKTLESIGQKSSIKQFSSFQQMKKEMSIGDDLLSAIEKQQMEFICHQQTPDEDRE